MVQNIDASIMDRIIFVDKYYDDYLKTGKRLGAIAYTIKKIKEAIGTKLSRENIKYYRSAGNILRAAGLYDSAVKENWDDTRIQKVRKDLTTNKIPVIDPTAMVEEIKEITVDEIEEELKEYLEPGITLEQLLEENLE